jgi:hypothetical protein
MNADGGAHRNVFDRKDAKNTKEEKGKRELLFFRRDYWIDWIGK